MSTVARLDNDLAQLEAAINGDLTLDLPDIDGTPARRLAEEVEMDGLPVDPPVDPTIPRQKKRGSKGKRSAGAPEWSERTGKRSRTEVEEPQPTRGADQAGAAGSVAAEPEQLPSVQQGDAAGDDGSLGNAEFWASYGAPVPAEAKAAAAAAAAAAEAAAREAQESADEAKLPTKVKLALRRGCPLPVDFPFIPEDIDVPAAVVAASATITGAARAMAQAIFEWAGLKLHITAATAPHVDDIFLEYARLVAHESDRDLITTVMDPRQWKLSKSWVPDNVRKDVVGLFRAIAKTKVYVKLNGDMRASIDNWITPTLDVLLDEMHDTDRAPPAPAAGTDPAAQVTGPVAVSAAPVASATAAGGAADPAAEDATAQMAVDAPVVDILSAMLHRARLATQDNGGARVVDATNTEWIVPRNTIDEFLHTKVSILRTEGMQAVACASLAAKLATRELATARYRLDRIREHKNAGLNAAVAVLSTIPTALELDQGRERGHGIDRTYAYIRHLSYVVRAQRSRLALQRYAMYVPIAHRELGDWNRGARARTMINVLARALPLLLLTTSQQKARNASDGTDGTEALNHLKMHAGLTLEDPLGVLTDAGANAMRAYIQSLDATGPSSAPAVDPGVALSGDEVAALVIARALVNEMKSATADAADFPAALSRLAVFAVVPSPPMDWDRVTSLVVSCLAVNGIECDTFREYAGIELYTFRGYVVGAERSGHTTAAGNEPENRALAFLENVVRAMPDVRPGRDGNFAYFESETSAERIACDTIAAWGGTNDVRWFVCCLLMRGSAWQQRGTKQCVVFQLQRKLNQQFRVGNGDKGALDHMGIGVFDVVLFDRLLHQCRASQPMDPCRHARIAQLDHLLWGQGSGRDVSWNANHGQHVRGFLYAPRMLDCDDPDLELGGVLVHRVERAEMEAAHDERKAAKERIAEHDDDDDAFLAGTKTRGVVAFVDEFDFGDAYPANAVRPLCVISHDIPEGYPPDDSGYTRIGNLDPFGDGGESGVSAIELWERNAQWENDEPADDEPRLSADAVAHVAYLACVAVFIDSSYDSDRFCDADGRSTRDRLYAGQRERIQLQIDELAGSDAFNDGIARIKRLATLLPTGVGEAQADVELTSALRSMRIASAAQLDVAVSQFSLPTDEMRVACAAFEVVCAARRDDKVEAIPNFDDAAGSAAVNAAFMDALKCASAVDILSCVGVTRDTRTTIANIASDTARARRVLRYLKTSEFMLVLGAGREVQVDGERRIVPDHSKISKVFFRALSYLLQMLEFDPEPATLVNFARAFRVLQDTEVQYPQMRASCRHPVTQRLARIACEHWSALCDNLPLETPEQRVAFLECVREHADRMAKEDADGELPQHVAGFDETEAELQVVLAERPVQMDVTDAGCPICEVKGSVCLLPSCLVNQGVGVVSGKLPRTTGPDALCAWLADARGRWYTQAKARDPGVVLDARGTIGLLVPLTHEVGRAVLIRLGRVTTLDRVPFLWHKALDLRACMSYGPYSSMTQVLRALRGDAGVPSDFHAVATRVMTLVGQGIGTTSSNAAIRCIAYRFLYLCVVERAIILVRGAMRQRFMIAMDRLAQQEVDTGSSHSDNQMRDMRRAIIVGAIGTGPPAPRLGQRTREAGGGVQERRDVTQFTLTATRQHMAMNAKDMMLYDWAARDTLIGLHDALRDTTDINALTGPLDLNVFAMAYSMLNSLVLAEMDPLAAGSARSGAAAAGVASDPSNGGAHWTAVSSATAAGTRAADDTGLADGTQTVALASDGSDEADAVAAKTANDAQAAAPAAPEARAPVNPTERAHALRIAPFYSDEAQLRAETATMPFLPSPMVTCTGGWGPQMAILRPEPAATPVSYPRFIMTRECVVVRDTAATAAAASSKMDTETAEFAAQVLREEWTSGSIEPDTIASAASQLRPNELCVINVRMDTTVTVDTVPIAHQATRALRSGAIATGASAPVRVVQAAGCPRWSHVFVARLSQGRYFTAELTPNVSAHLVIVPGEPGHLVLVVLADGRYHVFWGAKSGTCFRQINTIAVPSDFMQRETSLEATVTAEEQKLVPWTQPMAAMHIHEVGVADYIPSHWAPAYTASNGKFAIPAFWDPSQLLLLKLEYGGNDYRLAEPGTAVVVTSGDVVAITGVPKDQATPVERVLKFKRDRDSYQTVVDGVAWRAPMFVPDTGQRRSTHVTFAWSGMTIRTGVSSVLVSECATSATRYLRCLRLHCPVPDSDHIRSLAIPFVLTNKDSMDTNTLSRDAASRVEKSASVKRATVTDALYPIMRASGGACAAGYWFYVTCTDNLDRMCRSVERALASVGPATQEDGVTVHTTASKFAVRDEETGADPDADTLSAYLLNNDTGFIKRFTDTMQRSGEAASRIGSAVLATHADAVSSAQLERIRAERIIGPDGARGAPAAPAAPAAVTANALGEPIGRTSQSMAAFYAKTAFLRACTTRSQYDRTALVSVCLIDVNASLYDRFCKDRDEKKEPESHETVRRAGADLATGFLRILSVADDDVVANEQLGLIRAQLEGKETRDWHLEAFLRLRGVSTAAGGTTAAGGATAAGGPTAEDTAIKVDRIHRYLGSLLFPPGDHNSMALLPTRFVNLARHTLARACTAGGVDVALTTSWGVVDYLCTLVSEKLHLHGMAALRALATSTVSFDQMDEAPFASDDPIDRYIGMLGNVIMDVAGWPQPTGRRLCWTTMPPSLKPAPTAVSPEVTCTLAPAEANAATHCDQWVMVNMLRRRCAHLSFARASIVTSSIALGGDVSFFASDMHLRRPLDTDQRLRAIAPMHIGGPRMLSSLWPRVRCPSGRVATACRGGHLGLVPPFVVDGLYDERGRNYFIARLGSAPWIHPNEAAGMGLPTYDARTVDTDTADDTGVAERRVSPWFNRVKRAPAIAVFFVADSNALRDHVQAEVQFLEGEMQRATGAGDAPLSRILLAHGAHERPGITTEWFAWDTRNVSGTGLIASVHPAPLRACKAAIVGAVATHVRLPQSFGCVASLDENKRPTLSWREDGRADSTTTVAVNTGLCSLVWDIFASTVRLNTPTLFGERAGEENPIDEIALVRMCEVVVSKWWTYEAPDHGYLFCVAPVSAYTAEGHHCASGITGPCGCTGAPAFHVRHAAAPGLQGIATDLRERTRAFNDLPLHVRYEHVFRGIVWYYMTHSVGQLSRHCADSLLHRFVGSASAAQPAGAEVARAQLDWVRIALERQVIVDTATGRERLLGFYNALFSYAPVVSSQPVRTVGARGPIARDLFPGPYNWNDCMQSMEAQERLARAQTREFSATDWAELGVANYNAMRNTVGNLVASALKKSATQQATPDAARSNTAVAILSAYKQRTLLQFARAKTTLTTTGASCATPVVISLAVIRSVATIHSNFAWAYAGPIARLGPAHPELCCIAYPADVTFAATVWAEICSVLRIIADASSAIPFSLPAVHRTKQLARILSKHIGGVVSMGLAAELSCPALLAGGLRTTSNPMFISCGIETRLPPGAADLDVVGAPPRAQRRIQKRRRRVIEDEPEPSDGPVPSDTQPTKDAKVEVEVTAEVELEVEVEDHTRLSELPIEDDGEDGAINAKAAGVDDEDDDGIAQDGLFMAYAFVTAAIHSKELE